MFPFLNISHLNWWRVLWLFVRRLSQFPFICKCNLFIQSQNSLLNHQYCHPNFEVSLPTSRETQPRSNDFTHPRPRFLPHSPSGDFQTLVVINARSAGPLLFWAHYIVRSDQGFPTWRKKIPFFGGFPKCRYTDRLCDPMSNSLNLRTIFFTISVVGSAKEWSLGCVKHAPPRGQRRPGHENHAT